MRLPNKPKHPNEFPVIPCHRYDGIPTHLRNAEVLQEIFNRIIQEDLYFSSSLKRYCVSPGRAPAADINAETSIKINSFRRFQTDIYERSIDCGDEIKLRVCSYPASVKTLAKWTGQSRCIFEASSHNHRCRNGLDGIVDFDIEIAYCDTQIHAATHLRRKLQRHGRRFRRFGNQVLRVATDRHRNSRRRGEAQEGGIGSILYAIVEHCLAASIQRGVVNAADIRCIRNCTGIRITTNTVELIRQELFTEIWRPERRSE